MNKEWQYKDSQKEKIEEMVSQYHIGYILATVLANKEIEKEELDVFLNPTRKDFHSPFLMPDMEVAVKRIVEAIAKKQKILIYGDYDVDGITSTTVLKSFLKDRGVEALTYIPNRIYEGYGLNKEAMEKIAEQKVELMITVDCGISAIEEIAYAKQLGIQTIVTDHHEVGEALPTEALAIVDAKRKDSNYPFKGLAGVGVVFKLIQAISQKMQLEEKEYLKYLDIVCIGTISDIVPLEDENRVITKLGLKLVEVTKNIGLKMLLQSCGFKKIDSTTISFGIAPRINACGRMGHEQEALNLFLTENIEEARQIAQRLNEYNTQRQELERNIFEEADKMIQQEMQTTLEELPVIVLEKEGWHHGVIGIVSSKITEKYFKPSILLCNEGEEMTGSGRSIPGFDLYEALSQCQTYIQRYGGHEMAVGVTLQTENFSKFKQEFEKYAQNSHICDILPIILIDSIISLKEVTVEEVKQLSLLEPYGEANRMPLFAFKNLKITAIRALSEGKHIKMTVKDENYMVDVIGFQMGNLTQEYCIGDKVDIVGSLEINSYGGVESLQIHLKDIMKSIDKK